MLRKVGLAAIVLMSVQCSDMQNTNVNLPAILNTAASMSMSDSDISSGLKEALNLGIQNGISNLGQPNGFYSNSLVAIALPPELQQVDTALRNMGLGALSDQGIKLLNSAASDAVSTAAPIFTNALQQMSFSDVRNVLFGGQNAATQYLQGATTNQLVSAFEPKISQSLGKVGADQAWANIITKYNAITGKNINPNLTQYVTQQAVNGVFVMVAQKETDIRSNVNSRTTDVLQRVFALQDK